MGLRVYLNPCSAARPAANRPMPAGLDARGQGGDGVGRLGRLGTVGHALQPWLDDRGLLDLAAQA